MDKSIQKPHKKFLNAATSDEIANRIPTNLRTLLILEVLGNGGVAMSPTQINAKIGLPKQTIHRLCKTMLDQGFLAKEGRTNPRKKLLRAAAGADSLLSRRD